MGITGMNLRRIKATGSYGLSLCLAVAFPGVSAAADLPACASPTAGGDQMDAGCVLSWVEDGTHRIIRWHASGNDFEAPVLSFTPGASFSLQAQQPPSLIDVDQDGIRDVVAFSLIGQVNGDHDIFLYQPDSGSYAHAAAIPGYELSRDKSGYLLAPSRSGPGQHFGFYSLSGSKITPAFAIEPTEGGPPHEKCQILSRDQRVVWAGDVGTLPILAPRDAELMDHYCNIYAPSQAANRATVLTDDPSVQYVPESAAIYCRIEGSKGPYAATVSRQDDGYLYSYGPAGGEVDLTMISANRQGDWRKSYGADKDSLRDEMHFASGGCTYILYEERPVRPESRAVTRRGLTVLQDGATAPIFQRICDPSLSFMQMPAWAEE